MVSVIAQRRNYAKLERTLRSQTHQALDEKIFFLSGTVEQEAVHLAQSGIGSGS